MKRTTIIHEFVDHIPETLEDGKIYISMSFATAVHKCCCGCGNEVVTTLSPTGWELTYNGETNSLGPSIATWNFPCQSHYWIKCDKVRWARQWTRTEIETGRAQE